MATAAYASTNCPSFVVISECACVGQMLTYQCTTQGSSSTIWDGSAFQCISNSIILRHSQYPHGAADVCNNGLITGQSLRVNGDCFTSQLNVTISSELNGRGVRCTSGDRRTIGTNFIFITTGNL